MLWLLIVVAVAFPSLTKPCSGLGSAGAGHLYAFVGNNPYGAVEPLGLEFDSLSNLFDPGGHMDQARRDQLRYQSEMDLMAHYDYIARIAPAMLPMTPFYWAGGTLGAGIGRDWLGFGFQAGLAEEIGRMHVVDPYELDLARGVANPQISYAEQWRYVPAEALKTTLSTAANAASWGLTAFSGVGGVARVGMMAARASSVALRTTGAFAARTAAPNGNFYSVAYEMRLNAADIPRGDWIHFNRANAALDNAIRADAQFARQMESLIPGVRDAVSTVGGRANPPGWTWHHHPDRLGVLQLVPTPQHTAGSIFWNTMHPPPTFSGGYANWAVPAGAPRR